MSDYQVGIGGRQVAIQLALERALNWLESRQQHNGYFMSYVATDPDITRDRLEDRSVFITQHVAASLLEVDHPLARRMTSLALDFLRQERWSGNAWKFWTKDHPGAWAIPLDTDDTACVAHLFVRSRQPLPPPTRDLLFGNRTHSGLFRTWLVPRLGHLARPRVWAATARMLRHPLQMRAFFAAGGVTPADVDAVVNANAVLLFGACKETTPAINWIHDVVCRGVEVKADRFYQSRQVLYYAIVRCWRNGCSAFDDLQPLVKARLHQLFVPPVEPLSSLDAALCAIVLGSWAPGSESHDRALKQLLVSQSACGFWSARVLFFGDRSRRLCWGSEELTTAFCVEAFAIALRSLAS